MVTKILYVFGGFTIIISEGTMYEITILFHQIQFWQRIFTLTVYEYEYYLTFQNEDGQGWIHNY